MTLKSAGNVIANSSKKKINVIYENGIIVSNYFINWKNISHYYYYFSSDITFVKCNSNKEIVMKIDNGDKDRVFALLRKKGINRIDQSS